MAQAGDHISRFGGGGWSDFGERFHNCSTDVFGGIVDFRRERGKSSVGIRPQVPNGVGGTDTNSFIRISKLLLEVGYGLHLAPAACGNGILAGWRWQPDRFSCHANRQGHGDDVASDGSNGYAGARVLKLSRQEPADHSEKNAQKGQQNFGWEKTRQPDQQAYDEGQGKGSPAQHRPEGILRPRPALPPFKRSSPGEPTLAHYFLL
jgi:hypothetical protein